MHYPLKTEHDSAPASGFAVKLRGPLLFGTVLGLLIFSLYAGFAFHGARAWLVGFIYISYDSALLIFMVVSSQYAVRHERRAVPPTAVPRPTRYRPHLRAQ